MTQHQQFQFQQFLITLQKLNAANNQKGIRNTLDCYLKHDDATEAAQAATAAGKAFLEAQSGKKEQRYQARARQTPVIDRAMHSMTSYYLGDK